MRRLAIGVMVFGALAAGCQGAAQRPPATVSFSAEEAAFIKKPGNGVISGHAFRTRSNGRVVNAAGELVRLVPATAYSRERFGQLYGNRKFLPVGRYPGEDKVDPGYAELTRTVKSSATGRFSFEGVPPGTYFVTAQVVWGEELNREGGSMYDIVTLTGRETKPVEVILSGN